MRILLPALAATVLLVMACGGENDDFKDNANAATPTALGASTGPLGTVAAATPTQCAQQYTVVSGDTLSGIAAQFNIELQTIIDANGIVDPSTLAIGQQITIPCVASSTAVTPVPTVTAGP
jgi:LysM repeat protein